MDLDRVAPQLRQPARRAAIPMVERALVRRVVGAATALMPAARVAGVTIERRAVGRGVRLYRPSRAGSDGALLFIHGGGFVIGAAVINDRLCAEAAATLGITVVSAGYRLAPEHPYPAALDDVRAAWAGLGAVAASLGVDPARVVVGGESAGGGLAAALVARLHDEGGVQPAGQLLFCPMLDDRTAADRTLDEVGHFVWDNRRNRFGWRSYLAAEPGAPDVPPDAAPARRASLAGLPPAWIGYGTIELFGAEDAAYAERLRAAGVAVDEDVVEGAPHGFETWAPDSSLARGHRRRAWAWLGSVLGVPLAG